MTEKKIQGWNPTYFGEPKKGSLASVIADITNKQNEQQGGKPEVADSVAVQAQKEKQALAKEGKMIIFPSSLSHEVEENKSDEDRISYSFNIVFASINKS